MKHLLLYRREDSLGLGLGLGKLVCEAVVLAKALGIAGLPNSYLLLLEPQAFVTSLDGPCTLYQAVTSKPR